ncbi:MAG: hypothetical protein IJZ13_03105, partial [Clostridia bacterium]|nr:hypothetical protein [Clostridia bacterium]
MKLYYYHDRFGHAQLNAIGRDYTPAYLPAMLKNLGFSSTELTPAELSKLEAGDTLVMGADTLSAAAVAELASAMDRGVKVLAFATKAEGVFPATEPGVCGDDPYAIVGYFRFAGSDEPLPVLGGFEAIPAADKVLGAITAKDGGVYTTYAQLAEGVWYWSFDLPATLLYAADGRPTQMGENGFFIGRVPDGCVLEPDYDYDIAYGDSYLRSVEDVLSAAGFAHIWALPEQNGRVCDIVLYFGGDDDAFSAENDLRAAEAMYERGLPYHINLMPADAEGHFVVTPEDVERLHELGCETAIHYNFTVFPFSEEGHKMQMALYEKALGDVSGGPVNHCVIQVGTAAERYRMQVECGAKSDNNRIQNKTNPEDINAFNLTGFAFGHAFPRFVLADAVH